MSSVELTTIAIMGEEVEATHVSWEVDKLLFLPDNPRVYAAIRQIQGFDQLTDDEKQAEIYEQLLKETSVKKLRPEIERDGGLQEAILVRHDTNQVIEGNSRLAVYRQLNRANPNDERWQTIRCLSISKLTDDQQVRLLGQAHLHGKTDWSAYAKALFCYRWVREDGNQPVELSEISGLSVRAINKEVAIIELMRENTDDIESHYSYYNVAITSKKISFAINDENGNKPLRDVILSGIRNEDFKAQELRDWLPIVLDKPKVAKKFASGAITLKDAHDRAEVSETKTRLDRVFGLLDAIEDKEINALDYAEIRSVQQVARRVNRKAERLLDVVGKRVAKTAEKRLKKPT